MTALPKVMENWKKSQKVALNSNITLSFFRTNLELTRSDFEKHFTMKNCDKTFLKIILRLKKLLKSDDVSTLTERHYQVKIS